MIKYPDGKTYQKKNIKLNKYISYANRGMSFEEAINKTNNYYLNNKIALIYKRPTPITVTKMDYSNGAKITEGFFASKSTTDYNGIYKGKYIDFEAKSCLSKTSFPLNNISPHQITHLQNVIYHGGIAFFLIQLKTINEVYLLTADYIIDFYNNNKRKSIPVNDIKKYGYLVKEGYSPRFDYLACLEKLHFTKQ